MVDRKFGVDGALWALRHCINISDNPSFYDTLPDRQEEYEAGFKKAPLLTFSSNHKAIYILIDFGDRILWDFGKSVRVFGNVWKLGESIVLKGAYLFFPVLYNRIH